MDAFTRLWDDIGDHGIMVLSTCACGRVTSRSMSVVVYDGKFFCQTNADYLKCSQIAVNPNAALCFGKYSVEGICSIKGHPTGDSGFMAAMERAYPDAVKRWSHLPEERVIEITPVLMRSWIYEDGVPYIEQWDMRTRNYTRDRQ